MKNEIISAALGVVVAIPICMYAGNHWYTTPQTLPKPEAEVITWSAIPEAAPQDRFRGIQRSSLDEARHYLSEKKIAVPGEYRGYFATTAEQYGLTEELLEAVAFRESTFNPNAINGSCMGLMQINPAWHQERIGGRDVMNPEVNIEVGADYLSELLEDHNLAKALMIYNGDEGKGVSTYAEDIIQIAKALEVIHEFEPSPVQ